MKPGRIADMLTEIMHEVDLLLIFAGLKEKYKSLFVPPLILSYTLRGL